MYAYSSQKHFRIRNYYSLTPFYIAHLFIMLNYNEKRIYKREGAKRRKNPLASRRSTQMIRDDESL